MIAWVVLLFLAGMALILAEFLVPGMICGILGGTLVLGSAILGWRTYPDHVLLIAVGEIVGVFFTIALGMYLMVRTRASRPLVLSTTQQADAGYVAADSDVALIGAEGDAQSMLRPAGAILVNGRRIDAVSSGEYIPKGARIRVIDVQGSRVVVEKL